MRHLFTYGPVPAGAAESVPLTETEIGLVPEGWEVEKISRTCKVKSSSIALPTLPSMGTGNDADFLVHGIKVSDMNLPQNEREILGANIEVRLPKGVAEKKAIPPMSTVFPKRGAAIATNKKRLTTTWTILDPNLIAVVPGSGVNPYFLYYWFLIFDIKSIQSPGPTPQLNKKDVEPVQFPLPPLHTQQKIASILSTVDKKIEAEENKKIALDELFKSLLHNLMTGKIRVNHLEVTQ
jgi:type I restriction enzyme S subunit